MAGRVGRMGTWHVQGRVVFTAKANETNAARRYLNLGELSQLRSRVAAQRFNQLALQLVGSGLCSTRNDLEVLVCSTLSAEREQKLNPDLFRHWPNYLSNAVDELLAEGLLIETTTGFLSVTPVGKAIGQSGLLPETGVFLLDYVARKAALFVRCLPSREAAVQTASAKRPCKGHSIAT